MDLKNIQWVEFVFENIFKIHSTNSGIDKNKLNDKKGKIPYITRSDKNNGIDFFIGLQDEKYKQDNGNVITIGLDTQTVFYQSHFFYTGQNIQILSNDNLNYFTSQFLIPLIKIQMEKFNWGGNGATLTRLKRSKIILPTNLKGEIDYAFMEQFLRYKEEEKITKFQSYIVQRIEQVKDFKEVEPLNKKEWGEFFIEDIAEIISGRDIYEAERINGDTPYVSATANNNGIGYFVGNTNGTLEEKCLSVNRNGSVGYSFYHHYKALFSNDCRKLRLKNNSPFVGKFISRIITGQKEKYGYGYKMGTGRIKRQKILLPIVKKGQPDYEYMENYIKKLEHEKLTKYLRLKKGHQKE